VSSGDATGPTPTAAGAPYHPRADDGLAARALSVRRLDRRLAVPLLATVAVALVGLASGVVDVDGPAAGVAGVRASGQPVTEYAVVDRGAPVSIEGRDLSGAGVSTADFRGSPLVLNVWGSWCAPCRTEAPVLRTVSDEYARAGVRFLGLNVKDNVAAATAFERRFGIGYPSLDDSSGQATLTLSTYLPASVVPATLVLDAEGRVAARVLGAVEESTLRSLLEKVIPAP
jgi:thiol-disulfide isomerase/thioredoxin